MFRLAPTIATVVVVAAAGLISGSATVRAQPEQRNLRPNAVGKAPQPTRPQTKIDVPDISSDIDTNVVALRDGVEDPSRRIGEQAGACVFGDPPATSCSTATVISGAPGHHVVHVDASGAVDIATSCDVSVEHTVWFEVTPTISGPLTFSTCHPGTTYDTVIEAWSGQDPSCKELTFENCMDDTATPDCDNGCANFGSTLTIDATADERYLFQVGASGNEAAGCDLCLAVVVSIGDPCGDAPTNFACKSARQISGKPGTHEVLVDATDAVVLPEETAPFCVPSDTGNTVWFSLMPAISGLLTLSTCHPNTSYDTVIEAYTGDCQGVLSSVSCLDDTEEPECVDDCSSFYHTEMTINVAAGQEILFMVGSYGGNKDGCDLCLGLRTTLFQCVTDESCDDGNDCTDDSCTSGVCLHLAIPNGVACADDGNECTDDRCNGLEECVHTARAAGSACGSPFDDACNDSDTCDGAGVCLSNLPPAGTPCADDGNDCTEDVCDGGGACVHNDLAAGTPCTDEGDACTDDTCDGAGACLHVDNTAACDDDVVCTTNDVCAGGSCAGEPVDCGDLDDQCNLGACNPKSGLCKKVAAFEGAVCNLGESCTVSAKCRSGECLGDPVDCSGAGGACNSAFCEPEGPAGNCNGRAPLTAGADCDDGLFCNGFSTCDGSGVCVSGDPPCGPGEVCDEETQACRLESDCNENGIADACDIDCGLADGPCDTVPGCGSSADCNENGVPDECDVADRCGEPIGFCPGEGDCCDPAGNGTPGCECSACCIAVCLVAPFCCTLEWDETCAVAATVVDGCDCGSPVEFSLDCNGNGVPDECEADCDGDDIPNECEIADCLGDSACDDCNQNGIPDGCDLASGFSLDVNPEDGLPDECVTSAPGEHDWTSDIWNLGGGYPDNVDNVSGLHVTIDAAQIFLNETVEIEGLRLRANSSLLVSQLIEGDLTIDPESGGGIINDGEILVANDRSIDVQGGSFVLGEGAKYMADPTSGGLASGSLVAQSLTLLPTVCGALDQLTMSGAMSGVVLGDLVLDGSEVHPCPCRFELCPPAGGDAYIQGGRTLPIFRLSSSVAVVARTEGFPPTSAPLAVHGAFRILFGAEVEVGSDAEGSADSVTVALSGDFDNQSVFPSLFDWSLGGLIFESSQEVRSFEVAGLDLGPMSEGFDTDADALFDRNRHTNFAMGLIKALPGSNVVFVNERTNTAGAGPLAEALYVRDLDLGLGARITLDNIRIYFERLVDHGAMIETTGDGALVPLPTGDYDGDGTVSLGDWKELPDCLTGPDNGPIVSECSVFDFDSDDDVDMDDVSEWIDRFNDP